MKFYGNGIVWDGERNKALCRFVNGELETDNDRIISKLTALEYPHDEVFCGTDSNGNIYPPDSIGCIANKMSDELSTMRDTLTKAQIIAELDRLKIPYTTTDKRSKTRLIELLGGADNGEPA